MNRSFAPIIRSTHFERSADLGIVKGRFVKQVQDLDVPQILVEGSLISSLAC
jgi:hypothetical protein